MCGIAGFVDLSRSTDPETMAHTALTMVRTLRHRGPDDEGVWVDPPSGVAFGHRRLAILDLSQDGHQPMVSGSGRYVVNFNGEIYNQGELRAQLEGMGHRFRGHCDTEVMLAAFDQWGMPDALSWLNGMFALALWDRKDRRLHFARDRMGEKPLYYGIIGNALVFGSELKALRAHPSFRPEIDRDALALFLRYGYVPAPRSIYQGINKLPAASVMTMDPFSREISTYPYWNVREVAMRGQQDPFRGTDDEAADALGELLADAVGIRMYADVGLGAFLSGGIDSSTIAALMQQQSSRPVKTFTIGSLDKRFDEAFDSRRVASHLGTDHTELNATAEEALSVVPELPALYDEPFADSSQIPTFLVSRLAREHVTVSLSGDGGDELFGGYNRHHWVQSISKTTARIPAGLRKAAARALESVPPDRWDRWVGALPGAVPGKTVPRLLGDKVFKLAGLLRLDGPEAMYQSLVSHWKSPEAIVLGSKSMARLRPDNGQNNGRFDPVEYMMLEDMTTYLPDDILVKLDRATMAVGLEGRVPFLDHRVVEFAWRLPPSQKLRGRTGKWVLRGVLDRYVPKALVERQKMGFGIPLGDWLRGPLRSWAEAHLDAGRLRHEGFFDPWVVREKWDQHLSGARSWEHHLWDVLVFQSWIEKQPLTVAAE